MDIPKHLIAESFNTLSPHLDEVVAQFYDNLFGRHPDLRPLFGNTDMAEQRRMLRAALIFTLETIENPGELTPRLIALGKRHAEVGVRPEHFPLFTRCLLDTMAHHAGTSWTPEVEQAWEQTFALISQSIIDGLESERG